MTRNGRMNLLSTLKGRAGVEFQVFGDEGEKPRYTHDFINPAHMDGQSIWEFQDRLGFAPCGGPCTVRFDDDGKPVAIGVETILPEVEPGDRTVWLVLD